MEVLRETLSDEVLQRVFAAPDVRSLEVERARRLLSSAGWCHADEVALELVSCYVRQRLP